MQDLTVTLLQSPLHWESPEANRAMFEEKIWQIGKQTDLIVLPEMFTSGFTMNVEPIAEPMNLSTFKWMKQQAAQTGAVVTGSYIVKEGGKYFNRLLWMQPDGNFSYYDKRHLFRMAGEHEVFSAGAQKIVVSIKDWKICPLICYDLRFPVWSRNAHKAYDVLLYVANWPEARSLAWKSLLQARAIENSVYAIGVNRVGEDGKGIAYSGDSSVISPKGELLWQNSNKDDIYTHVLSWEELESFRQKFPVDLDADDFLIP
jgi:omega-amidase